MKIKMSIVISVIILFLFITPVKAIRIANSVSQKPPLLTFIIPIPTKPQCTYQTQCNTSKYTFIDLGAFLGGNYESRASGLNNQRHVVGSGGSNTGDSAFEWFYNGMNKLVFLPSGDLRSYAYKINNSGVVVGSSYKGNGERPVYWKNNSITDLGFWNGDDYGSAFSINDKEEIVGYSGKDNKTHALLWKNGSVYDLLPVSNLGKAFGINLKG